MESITMLVAFLAEEMAFQREMQVIFKARVLLQGIGLIID